MIQPTTPATLATRVLLPLFVLALGTGNAWANAAAGRLRPAADVASLPYGLESRPRPEGRSLEEVLPREVGSFVRGPLDGFTDLPANADLNVDYRDERATVTVGVTVAESPELARSAVRAARSMCGKAPRGSPAPAVVESLDGDPAFVKAGDFIAWSRGRHFFYVKASSPAALDQFMRHFPY
jgi:hypothetical protein